MTVRNGRFTMRAYGDSASNAAPFASPGGPSTPTPTTGSDTPGIDTELDSDYESDLGELDSSYLASSHQQ